MINKQAAEAGRQADELHQRIIAEMNGNTVQAAAPGQPTSTPALEDPSAGTQEHQNDTWEQKFKVIEGKYRAEVPLLHQRVRTLEMALQDKDQDISDLKQKLVEAKTAQPTAQPSQPSPLANFDQIEDEFGTGVADTLRAMQGQIEALKAENQSLKSGGGQPQAAPVREPEAPAAQPQIDPLSKQRMDFVVDLVGGLAEFNRIDNDPNFNLWLDGQDHPAYPESRRENLQRLFSQGKLSETAAYFISWNQSVKGGARPADALQEQLQPSVTQGGGNPADERGTKIWTISEIRELQKQFAVSPRYKTKEGRAEAEALEAEFLAANQQGRIINK